MAVLAADVNYSSIGQPDKVSFSANGADVFYAGAIVYSDTGGGVQVVPAAGDRAVGVCAKQVTTTAAGDEVEVYVDGIFWVPVGSGITAADEGSIVIHDISASQTDNWADCISLEDATLAANDIFIGQIMRVTATQMLVAIKPGITGRLAAATATNLWT